MCDGNSFGGITGDMFATPFNTIGMGDVMPPQFGFGSGDKFSNNIKPSSKSEKKNKNNSRENNLLMTPPLLVYTKKETHN